MKKEDKILSDLFRQKLENAVIDPSPSVNKELMHRLGRREFMHFNPARFNFWYAASIVVAGTALALILFSGQNRKSSNEPASSYPEMSLPVSPDDLKSGVVREPARNILRNNDSREEKGRRNGENPKVTDDIRRQEPSNKAQSNNVTSPSGIVSSVPGPDLSRETASGKDRLRNKVNTEANIIRVSATAGCAPLSVKFMNTAVSSGSCTWTFGDGGTSSQKDPVWLFDIPGEYNVTLKVYSGNDMLATASTLITVRPGPVARFEISPENAVLPDDEIRFINYSTDAVKYFWDFGDGTRSELFEPRHFYRKFGNYNVRLVAVSESGCSDSTTVLNAFSSKGWFIDFPNAFIPNPNGPSGGYYSSKSDEAAQVFHPVSTGVSEYQLKIFSKIGILIFESNDINIGWDGYFKGQLSEQGVYVWKVRGNFTNGEPFTKMGDVTLLKN